MARRKHTKPGSYGRPVAADPLIADDPELASLDAALLANGWRRAATVQPYRRRDGWVTVQFVWRKRAKDISLTHTVTWRVPFAEVMAA